MVPFQFNVDIFSELNRILDVKYEIVIPDKVIGELKGLSKKGGLMERKAVQVALGLSEGIKKISVEVDDVDAAILSITDSNTVVCTNDRDLKKRVLEKGGRVVFLRQKRTLDLAGGSVGVS